MNLAPRKGFVEDTCTSSNVGPNTYNVTYPCCDYRKENYAPFLSTAPRSKTIKPTVDVTYDIPQNRSKIKYGNSLQFTAPRKTIAIASNLEPNELAGIRQQQVKQKPSRKLVGGGKLYLCHMPFNSGVCPPSVPTRIDENGYLVTEDNDLIKRPPNEHDNTLGPAYYDVPMGELCYNTFKYKGWTWSKMKGKRGKLVTDIGPGPAVYTPKMPKCVRYIADETKFETTRKCCEVPRFTCEKICRAKAENFPGPGYYEIVDIDKMGKLKNLSLGPPPFINAAKRFTYEISQLPGPQDHLVCDCYKNRRDFSFKDVAFCVDAERFRAKESPYGAGPASYSQTEPKYHRYTEKLMRAPFRTTQERTLLPTVNAENPGPGAYCLYSWGVRCCPNEPKQSTSVFKSNSRRFKRQFKGGPDPTTYSIVSARQQCHSKVEVPFNIKEKKFAKNNDFAGRVAGEGSPGVGEYDLNFDDLSSIGWHFNTSPRFKRRSPAKIPGPDHYFFHPVVSDALYKAKITHNDRLRKEVERNLFRSTRQNQLAKRTKETTTPERKVLRWFKTGTGVFKHVL